ncbi:hypothetical protein MTR_1g097755 [Medicago truncatula]|uniref:Uncharacterized protein n=1 Tax=Medicago truncatula TaxID=3880 RepID=A0A072VNN8_MEDTR|nr:hypothetical protein MTR_1g097755 [Medicago truncatula]
MEIFTLQCGANSAFLASSSPNLGLSRLAGLHLYSLSQSSRVEHEGNKNCKKEGKENYHMNNLRTKVGNKRNEKMETKLAEARKGLGV